MIRVLSMMVAGLVLLRMKRNKVIKDAITALKNLNHRGASGYEEGTGDGAGILFQIPDRFFRAVLVDIGVELPEEGKYAVGVMFLPVSSIDRTSVRALDVFACFKY